MLAPALPALPARLPARPPVHCCPVWPSTTHPSSPRRATCGHRRLYFPSSRPFAAQHGSARLSAPSCACAPRSACHDLLSRRGSGALRMPRAYPSPSPSAGLPSRTVRPDFLPAVVCARFEGAGGRAPCELRRQRHPLPPARRMYQNRASSCCMEARLMLDCEEPSPAPCRGFTGDCSDLPLQFSDVVPNPFEGYVRARSCPCAARVRLLLGCRLSAHHN